jgi:hypothetical protein
MSAWTLYSLAKETIAWGRAAYKDKKKIKLLVKNFKKLVIKV